MTMSPLENNHRANAGPAIDPVQGQACLFAEILAQTEKAIVSGPLMNRSICLREITMLPNASVQRWVNVVWDADPKFTQCRVKVLRLQAVNLLIRDKPGASGFANNTIWRKTIILKWNESGFRPPLCTYRLNWARRTSWGWWDDWDDTVLQTQDSKFEPWRSEAEHATSRSRRLPTILTFTRGWGRNNCFFQTAETGNRTPDSGVKGSGANHYPRAPAHNHTKDQLYLTISGPTSDIF